jgi:hypothetical protein
LQVILSGLSVFALWYDAPRARFIAFVVFYGILAGGYNALLPTTITEIYGTQNYANVNGFIYFIRGLGAIFGAPIAGVLLGSHKRGTAVSGGMDMGLGVLQKRYNDVVVYDGVLLVAAGVYVVFLCCYVLIFDISLDVLRMCAGWTRGIRASGLGRHRMLYIPWSSGVNPKLSYGAKGYYLATRL